MANKVSRRSFIKTSALATLGLSAGHLVAARSSRAAEPVKLFIGTTLSGAYAESGMYTMQGMKLALEHFGGKVLDRPIELIERDVPNPNEGMRKAQEAVERLGVKFLTVAPSSATVLAVGEYAAKKQVLMIGHAGSDKITGDACNKFTFRWQMPTWGAVREVVPRVMDEYKAKSFYCITPKYVFGEDLLRNTEEVLKEKGGKLAGNSFHPLGESDFASHITNAMAAKADVVLFHNFDADTVNALKQAKNMGLMKVSKVACSWGSGISQMKALGAELLEGVIWGLQYYHTVETPLNKKFVAEFTKKHKEAPPYVAASIYATTIMLLEAIKRAGADDPAKVVKAMEDFEYDGLCGKEKYRACDHQCIKPYYSVRCKAPKDMKDPNDWAVVLGNSSHYLPCDKTGCKMG